MYTAKRLLQGLNMVDRIATHSVNQRLKGPIKKLACATASQSDFSSKLPTAVTAHVFGWVFACSGQRVSRCQ